jgi:hypothetical protein
VTPARRVSGPLLTVAVVVGAAVAAALATAAVVAPGRSAPARPAVGTASPDGVVARRADSLPAVSAEAEVLARWDARRARAYARGDVAALRALYVAGSAAAARDVAVLRSYLVRGLRVRGLRMQLLAVEVREHRQDQIRLRVTDRVLGARAVARGWAHPLPADQPTSRAVTLVRVDGAWRVGGVSGAAPRAAGPPGSAAGR